MPVSRYSHIYSMTDILTGNGKEKRWSNGDDELSAWRVVLLTGTNRKRGVSVGGSYINMGKNEPHLAISLFLRYACCCQASTKKSSEGRII